MPVTVNKRASNDRWDKENMSYQTVKVRKELLDTFKETCKARGDRVNTVLREAMEDYIERGQENEKNN